MQFLKKKRKGPIKVKSKPKIGLAMGGSGADDYFTKPLNEEKLYLRIQQLTKSERKINGNIKCGAGT